MAEKRAAFLAAGTGKYEKFSGFLGTYDDPRRLREDQIAGVFLRPALTLLQAE